MTPPGAPYLRIAGEIQRRIDSGQLKVGDRIPSTRQISRQWGVAIATATKVLAELRQAGLVRVIPGVGVVVRDDVALRAAPPAAARRLSNESEIDLSPERIITTAVAIADAEGLAAVSMRRVATTLGAATMSLYRHVRSKDDLVVAMTNAVMGEDPLPTTRPVSWRDQLEVLARTQWAAYRRHPWLASVVNLTRPQRLPNGFAQTEWALRAVAELGWGVRMSLNAALTIFAFVTGLATNLEMQAQAERDSGISDDQWMQTQKQSFEALFVAGNYPRLAALTTGPDVGLDLDILFEFGLQRLLDGYAALRPPSR